MRSKASETLTQPSSGSMIRGWGDGGMWILKGLKMFIKPYLLKGLSITHANQVWCTDITYIPMRNGFMYMTAIIDVYSRKIVGWGINPWPSVGAKKYLKML